MPALDELRLPLWPDERIALTAMRAAGRFESDADVVRVAIHCYAAIIDAPIPMGPDTFQLGRQADLFEEIGS